MSEENDKSPAVTLDEEVLMVYIGDTEWEKHKLWQQWIEITENNGEPMPKRPNIRLWDKLQKWATVGAVYRFKGRHDEQGHLTVSKSPSFAGQWKNEEDRSRWQLEHRLVAIERDARREFLPDDVVDPVRRAYQRTPAFKKAAFLAWLMTAIQKRPSKAE